MTGTHAGSCLCGGVTFRAEGPLRDVWACHCTQCRKTSGHFWAATSVPLSRLHITADDTLAWFDSSERARRGFCSQCGASLFWKPAGEDRMAIAAGALDGPTGLRLAGHLHAEDAGDYYRAGGSSRAASGKAPDRLDCACLCGGVAFSLPGPAGPVTACHCRQCRKLSGHFAASFDADEALVAWRRRDTLAEHATPGGGRRGFCARCGSSLWFRSASAEFSVEAGAVTGPTGGWLCDHIFTANKGDYYAIDEGTPQSADRPG